jgi:hypothetical protein
MQNRSMFPYRRHGSKKRTKGGGGPMRKQRGPQKGLPNSARDLLPMLQPATKALAQMLAGRTAASGQLEQARAMLHQAERLIADRVHNRLNPAEREEFFEQLARLRLTLADAADEAEARAAEEQGPPRPPAPPVPQERLMEMALALATPEGARRRAPAGTQSAGGAAESAEGEEPAPAAPEESEAPAPVTAAPPDDDGAVEQGDQPPAPPPAEGPRRLHALNKGGRLELPRDAAANAAQTLSVGRSRPLARRRTALNPAAFPPAPDEPGAAAADQHGGNGVGAEAGEKKPPRRSRKTQSGLPEGWIIDEEGFVVPGPR